MDMEGMNMNMNMSDHNHSNSSATSSHGHVASMHMTFFWGSDAQILFSGWPGKSRPGMYFLALLFVFFLALFTEWLSHTRLLTSRAAGSSRAKAGLTQTLLHALRVGLAYLVMLAVMSFNGGVFLVAVGGHAVGFLIFGSRLFRNFDNDKVVSDLPPMTTCS